MMNTEKKTSDETIMTEVAPEQLKAVIGGDKYPVERVTNLPKCKYCRRKDYVVPKGSVYWCSACRKYFKKED